MNDTDQAITMMLQDNAALIGKCERLQVENAKLRELVRDMWCELDAATQYDAGGGRGVVYEFADRMHELEVTDYD